MSQTFVMMPPLEDSPGVYKKSGRETMWIKPVRILWGCQQPHGMDISKILGDLPTASTSISVSRHLSLIPSVTQFPESLSKVNPSLPKLLMF